MSEVHFATALENLGSSREWEKTGRLLRVAHSKSSTQTLHLEEGTQGAVKKRTLELNA